MEKTIKLFNLTNDFRDLKINNELLEEVREKIIWYINQFDETTEESELNIKNFSNKISLFTTLLARKTSIGTNTAEGIYIEDEELSKVEMEENKYKDEVEVIAAINFIKEYLDTSNIDYNNFSNWLKLKHKNIFIKDKKKNPGKLKTEVNYIPAKTSLDFQINFLNPNEVEIELAKLGMFAATSKLQPIILSAIVHAQLVAIHPFKDGNGRIARLVANKIIEKGYKVPLWIDEAISISVPDYHKAMNESHLQNNPVPIINFFLIKVIEQINRNYDLWNEHLINLKVLEQIFKEEKIGKYKHISDHLIINGATTVAIISQKFNLHRDTTKKILEILRNRGVLKIISNKEDKHKIYQYVNR